MQQSAIVNSNDASIIQREKEIAELAKGIIELADIFKELQTMVIDQGTMLDRIDYNIENMVSHVKGAEKELVQVGLASPSVLLTCLTPKEIGLPDAKAYYKKENNTTFNLNHSWVDNSAYHKTPEA